MTFADYLLHIFITVPIISVKQVNLYNLVEKFSKVYSSIVIVLNEIIPGINCYIIIILIPKHTTINFNLQPHKCQNTIKVGKCLNTRQSITIDSQCYTKRSFTWYQPRKHLSFSISLTRVATLLRWNRTSFLHIF